MRTLGIMTLMLVFTAVAHAQYTSEAADFFLSDRSYDTFLRDYFRFDEPKPLRVEYLNVNWSDSIDMAGDYGDRLQIEGILPMYTGANLLVDVPIRYSLVPIWWEGDDSEFGRKTNHLDPYLMTRWRINDGLKAVMGLGYSIKGDGEHFGESIGRKISLLRSFLSYDIHRQLNVVIGGELNRYYYDPQDAPEIFELADRLYYQPAAMLNWHPSESLIILLGIPYMGAHLELGSILKAEARVGIDEKAEIALSISPVERLITTLKFFNTPYRDFPVRVPGESFDSEPLLRTLSFKERNIRLEAGWKLNPAALAAVGLQYGFGSDVELRDRANKSIDELDGKSNFAIGATFTVDIEALLGRQ